MSDSSTGLKKNDMLFWKGMKIFKFMPSFGILDTNMGPMFTQ